MTRCFWLYARVLIFSSVSATSYIDGRNLGLRTRHLRASIAISEACPVTYFPSNLESIMPLNLNLLFRYFSAHSPTEKPTTFFVDLEPVSSSTKTTPKLYTSLLTCNFPNQTNSIKSMS